MAGLGGKNWTFEEEVTSSDVNGYLADQVVMRFADATARTAGFGGAGEPTLAEGMVSYLDDANRVEMYNGSAWAPVGLILQVVSTTKTDVFTTTSTSFVDVTGLSVSITPSSTSSKILLLGAIKFGFTGGASATHIRTMRDSTAIFVGDAAGSRSLDSGYVRDTYESPHGAIVFLDSPATTSATTYKIQIKSYDASRTAVINRPYDDGDSATLGSRLASTLMVMEIAG